MNIAFTIKYWKFIVMAVLAIALSFSINSCSDKSHQIGLLTEKNKTINIERDLAESQAKVTKFETESTWAKRVVESEKNANKNLQVAVAAASDSALAIDRLSKQVSDTDKYLSTGSHQAIIEYGKTCNSILNSMAERGGAIAKAADGHAIDAEQLDQAWPKQVKPDKQG